MDKAFRAGDELAHIEDSIRTGEFDIMGSSQPLTYEQMKAILQANGMDLTQYHSRIRDCDVFDIVNAENSIVKGRLGLIDVEMFIEQRGLRPTISPVEKYRQLFDASGKGTPEQSAYYCIIKALESSDPQAEIERRICKACDAIERHDNEVWHGPRGYRGYYTKQIALYKQALSELPIEEEPPTEEERIERQAQAHLEAAARHRDDPMF